MSNETTQDQDTYRDDRAPNEQYRDDAGAPLRKKPHPRQSEAERRALAERSGQPKVPRRDDLPQPDGLYRFVLPGKRPVGPDRPDKEILLGMPTEAIMRLCFEWASPWQDNPSLHGTMAQGYQLRLCLKEVAGERVGYHDLEEDALFDHIDSRDFSLLVAAMNRWTGNREVEVESFLASGELVG